MPSKILLMAATLLLLDTIFLTLLSIYLILSSSASGVQSATFTLMNQCSYPVWPGLLSGAGTPQLSTTGFALQPGHSNSLFVPPSWSGRLWGRTLCTLDSTGKFTCATADCGSGTLECAGAGGAPPATLAEFTLNGAGGMDFYDVSLVDGYNLPMMVVPRGGTAGNCTATGCGADLNGSCPLELKVSSGGSESESVACKSACEAFGDPKYCCSGEYGTPDTCRPSCYSEYFKSACPDAYSYAYDDGTSTFTCASSADYVITFCPSPAAAGRKSSGSPPLVPDGSLASTATKLGFSSGIIITVLVCVLATIWPVYWPCHASSSPARDCELIKVCGATGMSSPISAAARAQPLCVCVCALLVTSPARPRMLHVRTLIKSRAEQSRAEPANKMYVKSDICDSVRQIVI